MRKLFTLLSLLAYTFLSQAQITLVSTDMPAVGWVNVMQKDTLTGSINYGNRGTNQVYDFSAFHNDKADSLYYLAPTASQLSSVPGATLAITADHSTYIFAKNASTLFDFVGGQVVYSGTTLLTPFSPVDTGFKFTTAYGQNFRGTYGFTTIQPGSAFGQSSIYQVRITNTTTYTDTIDGWGTVKTPVGKYKCLRQHRIEHSSTLLEYKLFSFSPWANVPTGAGLPANPIVSVSNTYNYLSKETHGTVISFVYDSAGNPKTASWSTTPPAPTADFGYTLSTGGSVIFRDSSLGAPLTYSWNFGDGSAASTASNPNHTYTANGTYYVCLTVTNVSGTNTWCDSVHITSVTAALTAPTAIDDTASVVQPGSVTINATANDINHNAGDSLCITAVWGAPAGWTTLQGCHNIVFHPLNANYTGQDTFYYKVCSQIQPTLCDTAMVVVKVKAQPLPPTANNDTASVIQPGTVNINVLANDVNNNPGNTPCITTIWGAPTGWVTQQGCTNVIFHALDSTFNGLDTFYYKVCDQQLPTLCDTAMVVVNVRAIPISSFTFTRNGCVGGTFVSNAQNTDSLFWNFTDDGGLFDTTIINTNPIVIPNTATSFSGRSFQVCLTAKNAFGSSTVCDTVHLICVGINEISSSEFRIYPNPAADHIQLDLSGMDQTTMNDIVSIEILNTLGQKLKTVKANKNVSINVNDLSNGVYLIGVIDNNNSRKVLGKFEVVR